MTSDGANGATTRAQVEVAADAPRDGVGHVARERILGDFRQSGFVALLDGHKKIIELVVGESAPLQDPADGTFSVRPTVAKIMTAGELARERIAKHNAHASAVNGLEIQ